MGSKRFSDRCPQGHLYTPSNTVMVQGSRRCKTCRTDSNARHKAAKTARDRALSAAHCDRIKRLRVLFPDSCVYDETMKQLYPGVPYERLTVEERSRIKYKAIEWLQALNEWDVRVPDETEEAA